MPDSYTPDTENSASVGNEQDWPLQQLVHLQDVPPSGKHMPFELSAGDCAAVARYLDVPNIAFIRAELHLKPYSNGDLRVTGTITARVTYICGISLQPYEDDLHADVNILYVDPERRRQLLAKWDLDDILDLDKDIPDELINSQIPIGALISEHMALALDPYPRRPDVEFEAPGAAQDDEDVKISPFAGLKLNDTK